MFRFDKEKGKDVPDGSVKAASPGNNFAYSNPAFDKDPEAGEQGKLLDDGKQPVISATFCIYSHPSDGSKGYFLFIRKAPSFFDYSVEKHPRWSKYICDPPFIGKLHRTRESPYFAEMIKWWSEYISNRHLDIKNKFILYQMLIGTRLVFFKKLVTQSHASMHLDASWPIF